MAHEGLWEQLVKLDRHQTSRRAKCLYRPDTDDYVVRFLNADYVVNLQERKIYSLRSDLSTQPAEFLEQLCILAYLINAKDIPLAGKLMQAEVLPGGQFFFRGLHKLPTEKLEKTFGDCPQAIYKAAEQFDAKQCEFGDASVEFYVLPRIPLTIIVWRRDEEFDARASILFDQTAGDHMPLDALQTAVNLAVEALVKAEDKN